MNIYEDATLEPTLDELSDQLGLLLLDLLRAALFKARRETQIFQEFTEAKSPGNTSGDPF